MKKIFKNQFVWISMGFAVLVIWGLVIYQNSKDKENDHESPSAMREKTVERARQIGRVLIETGFQRKIFSDEAPTPTPQNRGLASANSEPSHFQLRVIEEGQTGRDPWGYPFSYKKAGQKLYLWSPGPNHKLETPAAKIEASESMGDDIVVTLAI